MGKKLSKAHKEAWIAFFVAHGRLTKEIDRRMIAAGVVSMDVYDVLLILEMAPEHRMRMSELAEGVLLSRSGITRLVDRLERDGLITRQACPSDRRCLYAALTESGLRERERAWPIYEEAIVELFSAHMDELGANTVSEILTPMAFPDAMSKLS